MEISYPEISWRKLLVYTFFFSNQEGLFTSGRLHLSEMATKQVDEFIQLDYVALSQYHKFCLGIDHIHNFNANANTLFNQKIFSEVTAYMIW